MYEGPLHLYEQNSESRIEKISDYDSLDYIAAVLTELGTMASSANLSMLASLIEIARLESISLIEEKSEPIFIRKG